ncbi:general transcriptional corepressor trfA [Camellia sinensis]|uniref:Uncharacterized protein n=1 Tax=Camellia sinensis var. sinensis TaxID=542762 RepID=A0A4S4DIH5_CAMSN|nr:general transcriptional corepressor trfA [Camellia sinensis]THG02204.1 hypothetical protein TEA_004549 [Camellia sinensis var. sinensis]
MGCGMSRYGLAGVPDNEGARSSNPIRRKFDELCRNDRIVSDATPSSSKQLLKKGVEEDVVDSNSSHNSTDSMKDLALQLKQCPKAVDADSGIEKQSEEEEKEKEKEKEKCRKEVESKNEEAKAKATIETGDNKDNEESEEDEGIISNTDGSLWIGSPSFRDYCIDCDSDDNFQNDDNSAGKMKETKTRGDECHASPKSNEEMENKSIRKERKGRGFGRKVFPKSRQSAMRSLLHVPGCYNPSVSASHDRTSKPIDKTF